MLQYFRVTFCPKDTSSLSKLNLLHVFPCAVNLMEQMFCVSTSEKKSSFLWDVTKQAALFVTCYILVLLSLLFHLIDRVEIFLRNIRLNFTEINGVIPAENKKLRGL